MTAALPSTAVTICAAHYTSSGQCVGPIVAVPTPTPSAIAPVLAGAAVGGAAYGIADVFGVPLWARALAAGALALFSAEVAIEVGKQSAAKNKARQLAAGTCLGQSAWLQNLANHSMGGYLTADISNPPDSVLAGCKFLPSEYAAVRAGLAAFVAQSQAAGAATNASNEKSFTTAAAAIIGFFL